MTHFGGVTELYISDPDFIPTPKGTPYWRPNLPGDEKPNIGDIFDTFDDGYNMYKVYSEKGKFNIRKSGLKRYKGKVTHMYVLCNRAGKVRSKFDINTLKEGDTEDGELLGPTLAHRLKVALMGGYDKVRGTSSDYRNFKRALVNMFWADETKKCNYAIFGNVVSFDATFRYDFVFVPFTDQDAALRNAVVKMFPDSKHRLCMWHITQKLPGKVLGDLETDSEFRKELVLILKGENKQSWPFNSSKSNLGRRNKLGEMWDCQLGNLTAGKVSGGGGRVKVVEMASLGPSGVKVLLQPWSLWCKTFGDLAKQVPKSVKSSCKIRPWVVTEHLMARSGTDVKMAKLLSFKLYVFM
ncbi:FAR1-related sequence 5-like protein [Tanacetum coccineum]